VIMDIRNLPGSIKAAILIHSLGADASHLIMTNMDEVQRELIKKHLIEIGDISQDIVEAVSIEFINKLKQGGKAKFTNDQSVPQNRKGNPKSDKSENEVNGTQRIKALEALEADQIVELIKDEHPQTIAAITLHLDSQVASDVISRLPDDLIIDVSLRVANMDKILSGMIHEINDAFEELLRNKKTSAVHKTSGVKQLAEILNYSDQLITEQILSDIEKKNPGLAEEIKQRMFIFEDLILIDDKGMQKVLRKVESKELALALKGASDEVKRKIFKNMSKRAAEMLNEEIENMGAVRMKEVETAQQVINKIIQEMAATNEIVISGRGGEQFIA
jgi:flagellar motor switch protein FliG